MRYSERLIAVKKAQNDQFVQKKVCFIVKSNRFNSKKKCFNNKMTVKRRKNNEKKAQSKDLLEVKKARPDWSTQAIECSKPT